MSRLAPDSGDARGGEGRGEAAGRRSEGGRRPVGPFGYAAFRLLWLAGLSWTATRELRLLVVSFWLLEQTGSAAQLGILGAVQLAAQLALARDAGRSGPPTIILHSVTRTV